MRTNWMIIAVLIIADRGRERKHEREKKRDTHTRTHMEICALLWHVGSLRKNFSHHRCVNTSRKQDVRQFVRCAGVLNAISIICNVCILSITTSVDSYSVALARVVLCARTEHISVLQTIFWFGQNEYCARSILHIILKQSRFIVPSHSCTHTHIARPMRARSLFKFVPIIQ